MTDDMLMFSSRLFINDYNIVVVQKKYLNSWLKNTYIYIYIKTSKNIENTDLYEEFQYSKKNFQVN